MGFWAQVTVLAMAFGLIALIWKVATYFEDLPSRNADRRKAELLGIERETKETELKIQLLEYEKIRMQLPNTVPKSIPALEAEYRVKKDAEDEV